MPKNLFITYSQLFVLTLLSCSRTISVPEVEIISIVDNINNLSEIRLTELNCDIKYIKLERHENPLKSIYDIEFSDNYIFVTDLSVCSLYDISGKYVAEIGNQGRGPGEFAYPVNIDISKDNTLYIQDGKRFLVYDVKGNILRDFTPEIHTRLRFYMKNCIIFQDSLFLCHIPNYTGTEKFRAALINKLGQTEMLFKNWTYLNRKVEFVNSFDTHSNIYLFDDNIFFKEIMSDTLFALHENQWLSPVYLFNLGKYKLPIKEIESLSVENAKIIENYIFLDKIFETNDYLILDCDFNKHTPAKRPVPVIIDGYESNYYTVKLLGIFNKHSKELTFVSPENTDTRLIRTGIYNNIDGGPKFYPNVMINDSTMVMWIDAYQLKVYTSSEEFKNSKPLFPERKKELKLFANNLSENDNPILMVTTFKKPSAAVNPQQSVYK